MQILTQRNATIVFGLSFAWTTVATVPGLLPDGPVVRGISALLMGGCAFLGFMGFTRTPAGNTLPPKAVTEIDRQATLARAGDAVVEAVAAKVTEEAKKP